MPVRIPILTQLSLLLSENTTLKTKVATLETTVAAGGLGGGNTLRYGTGVPANTLGIDGDSYIDTPTGDLYTRAGGVYTPKFRATTTGTKYVEPANPYTFYPWVDGTLVINTAWLNANATRIIHDGELKWLITGLSRRNMTTGVNAVNVQTTDILLFRQCQFMGVGGSGTAVGTVGNPTTGNTRYEFEDCSFYGPHLNMTTGQYAGGLRAEYFTRVRVKNCNFIRSNGIQVARMRPTTNPKDGVHVEDCFASQLTGCIRDTTTPTGWRTGNLLDSDFKRCQFFQLNILDSAMLTTTDGRPSADVRWNHIQQRPENGVYIDDVINWNAITATAANPATCEWNLVDGAYSHLWAQNVAYSGGGIMHGDGGGAYQVSRFNTVLNTSNYALSAYGGNNHVLSFNTALSTGKTPDGLTNVDTFDPDSAMNIKAGTGVTAIVADSNIVRWYRPANNTQMNTYYESSNNPFLGTFSGPAGVVTQAEVDAAAARWQRDRLLAGRGVVGRRA